MLDKGNISEIIYAVLYEDGLVITASTVETMKSLTRYLMKKFIIIDLKDIKLFLGINISGIDNMTTLDESAYIKTIADKFIIGCKQTNISLESELSFIALKFDAPYKTRFEYNCIYLK